MSTPSPDTVVIYHGDNCQDGFGAAYVAWKEIGDKAIYHSVLYGAKPGDGSWPDMVGKNVLVLDYSLPFGMLDEVRAQALSFTQLDHHDTAMTKYASHKDCAGCVFDMDHSGAMLAWKPFHGEKPAPELLKDLEDFDLWRFDRETTIPFGRGVLTRPMDFSVWDTFRDPKVYAQVVEDGRVLEAQWSHWMEKVSQEALPVNVFGSIGEVVCANGAYRSELGTMIARKTNTYGFMWHGRCDGSIACSLRSLTKPCKPLAERLPGGGGHPNAAGFRLDNLAALNDLLGKPWDLHAPAVLSALPDAVSDASARADAAWKRLVGWRALGLEQSVRVDGRPVGLLPDLTTPSARHAAGLLLEAQWEKVTSSVVDEAVITAIPDSPEGFTSATVITDETVAIEVVHRLLEKGHQVVQTITATRTGLKRFAYGPVELVLKAWPDVSLPGGIDQILDGDLDGGQTNLCRISRRY